MDKERGHSISTTIVEIVCDRIDKDEKLLELSVELEKMDHKTLARYAAAQTKHITVLDRYVSILWLEGREALDDVDSQLCETLAAEHEAIEAKRKVIPFPKKKRQ